MVVVLNFGTSVLEYSSDIEKVREEARQKETRYLEIISHYEEELKKYKEELNIYQRREEEAKGSKENVLGTYSDLLYVCVKLNASK